MITTATIYQDLKAIIKLALEDRVVRGLNNIPAYFVENEHRNHISMTGKPAVYFYDLAIAESEQPHWGTITKAVTFNVGVKTRTKDAYFNQQVSSLLQMFSKESWSAMPYTFTYNSTRVNILPDIGISNVFHGQLVELRDQGDTTVTYIAEMNAGFTFSFNRNELS